MLHLSVIIFRDAEGKILLQFRDSQAPSGSLQFSFFGGIAEGDESPTDAMIREVEEEIGWKITSNDLNLLAEEPWVESDREKIVYFYEYKHPASWQELVVLEGAGAAFLTKEEIASMDNVTDLAKHFVERHIQ